MDNFIVQFQQALTPDFCRVLINKFNKDNRLAQGRTGAGVDLSKKNSTDLAISTLANWQAECSQIDTLLKNALVQYARMYPHFLIGAIAAKYRCPHSQQIKDIEAQDIRQMSDQQIAVLVDNIYQLEPINMQKYQPKVGGYPHLHSEHFPHPSDKAQRSLHRVLLWLIYLNDVEAGGETEFIYQNAKVKPVAGNLILAPCGFTHTHCGHPPLDSEKYVLASWVGFKSAADIYQQPK